MKKLILIDGNNLMFRSFYATFNQNVMRNSNGLPTNALFGFTSMINKIIKEENPKYIAVAFDIGKNFRKQKYDFYKEGRMTTPDELKVQMPYARKILSAMGIKYIEKEPYEADDIIGTLVKMAEKDPEFDVTIISSDKDLLQLINFETDVKLLKKDSFIRYNEQTFKEDYGIDPIRMIDLKALMGDTSDNIPGVSGIGEKTALKLLQEYNSLENLYDNIDNVKGKIHDKLLEEKAIAFMSKEIATIYKDIELDFNLETLKYIGETDELSKVFEELEFYSLLKKMDIKEDVTDFLIESDITKINLKDEVSFYLNLDNENYHYAKPVSLAITDDEHTYYFDEEIMDIGLKLLKNKQCNTFDTKKVLPFVKNLNIKNDLMIVKYLINETDNIITDSNMQMDSIKKSRFIHNQINEKLQLLKELNLEDLYYNIELPLINVLFEMEDEGIYCDIKILEEMKINIKSKLDEITNEIYSLAGEEFNISSPRQLGTILFEKMALPGGKKNKTGYVTDAQTLERIKNTHPIIEKIVTYRNVFKIYSSYLISLENYINQDGVIKPIYKQTLARTGRLSCSEPNLQNIPVKDELGKTIRKAFLPKNDIFLSFDYSQIELRILAHISDDENLINAFNNEEDIHTHVAADIFGKDEKDVTKLERKTAKAVIFGIVYGISGFGLGDNLNISRNEASSFINKYYELYPKVKKYMDNIIKTTKESGQTKTLMGRIRVIDEIKSPNFIIRQTGERMALNTPIQGTSADIIKLAMVRINKIFKENNLKSKMILQIHDELIFDVLNNEKEKIIKIVKENMENVLTLKVPLKVSADEGKNWYEV